MTEGAGMQVAGGCHCGHITYVLDWPVDTPVIAARQCGCAYCTRHGARWTAHPDARLGVRLADPGQVIAYRFATRTATFLACGRCGVLVLCTSEIDGRIVAVVNACTFGDGAPATETVPVSFEGEATGDRLARRARGWIGNVAIHATPPAWHVLYADASGLAWRTLEGVAPGRADAVDAFCPVHGNVRSFALSRMLAATDAATGRAVDPYAWLRGTGRSVTHDVDASAWPARLPVAALRSFAAATCGVDAARPVLADAAVAMLAAGAVDATALAGWVDRQWHVSSVELLRGSTRAYDMLRAALSPAQSAACRPHALAIAGLAPDVGTADAWAARATRDFPDGATPGAQA